MTIEEIENILERPDRTSGRERLTEELKKINFEIEGVDKVEDDYSEESYP